MTHFQQPTPFALARSERTLPASSGRARLAERAHFTHFNGEFIRHPHESTTIYFHLLWKYPDLHTE